MAKIRIEVEVGADGAIKGISAISGELKGFGSAASSSGASFAKLTGSFITAQAVIGGVKAGFRLLKDTISDTIGAAASFESAFTGVEKTLNTSGLSASETEVLFRHLRDEFEDLSLVIPLAFEELAGIGEIAGQLGVGAAQIVDFTDTIAKLGVTTNLTSEQAATQLARLAAVTGGIDNTNFERLGSSLVALGNNFATTEAEILGFGQRIAAAGDIVGLTQTDILALGAAFTSVGVPIEAGGTAVQRTLIAMSDAVAKGGADLAGFAGVANQSAQEFAAAFRDDAGGALVTFLEGLAVQGTAAFGTLEDLGLGSERTKTALLSAAQGSEQLAKALELSAQAFEENNALQREAELRFGTFDSQIAILDNSWQQLLATVGSFITENQALGAVVEAIREGIQSLTGFVKENRIELIELVSKGILYALQGIDLFLIGLDLLVGGFVSLVGFIEPVIQKILDFARVANAIAPEDSALKSFTSAVIFAGESTLTAADLAERASEGIQRFDAGVLATIDSVAEATRKQIEYEKELGSTALRLPDVGDAANDVAGDLDDLGGAADRASEQFEKLQESFGKIGFQQLRIDAALLQEVVLGLGGASALTASQLEAAGQQIELFEKNGVALGATLSEVKLRLEELKATEAVNKLVKDIDDLGKAAQKSKIDVLLKAVDQLGDASNLSKDQLEGLAKEIESLGLEAKDVPPELRKIQEELKALERAGNVKELAADFKRLSGQISMEGRAALEDIEEALKQTTEAGFELSREAMDEVLQQLDELAASDPGLKDRIKEVADEFSITRNVAVDFGAVMQDLSNIFQVFGISANSGLGQAVAGFAQLGAALPQLAQEFKEGGFGVGGAIGQGDVAGAATGIAGGIAGIAGATSSGGAGASAGKGAIAGATAGAQVGGPIGAAVGAAAGAIVGFFRGRARDKLRKDIEETVGAAVSEDLAAAIKEGAEEAGRTVQQQSLLSLGDIIGEVGIEGFEGGIQGVQNAALDLLTGIADGSLPAKEGIAGLGQAFTAMADEVFVAGQVADAELINIVKATRELGQDVPEITAFVADQLSLAAQGVSKLVGGIQIFDIEDAQAQATIFAGTFFATVEEIGLLEAVDAFGPAFEVLQEQIAQFGGDVNLGGVGRIFEIAKDENFRPLLEGVQGLDDALQGLANSGFLTEDSFAAFQQQAGSAFEQLTAQGLTAEESLQQMGPLLNNLVQASNEFGIPLEANTQALVEQAKAAGVAFRVEPMQQVADTLVVIAQLLGATDQQLQGLGSTAQQFGQQGQQAGVQFADGFDEARERFQGGIFGQGVDALEEAAIERGRVAGMAMATGIQEGTVGVAGQLQDSILTPFEETLKPAAEAFRVAIGDSGLEFDIVGGKIQGLGPLTAETMTEIRSAFEEGSVSIIEGLDPVAEKLATEIKEAGDSTSKAITESFDNTNIAIQEGLGEVAGTFTGVVVPAALQAAAATEGIANAARDAARAAAEIDFDARGVPDRFTASGFSGLLGRDMLFQAHQGEMVNVISADNVRKMRSGKADVSAQNGAGGIAIDMGGVSIPISIQGGEQGGGRFSDDFESKVLQVVERAIQRDLGGIVQDVLKPALQEQT